MKKRRMFLRLLVPEGKLRDALELYPGKTREEVRELLYGEVKKKLVPGIIAAVFFLVMAVMAEQKPQEKGGTAGPQYHAVLCLHLLRKARHQACLLGQGLLSKP